MKRYKPFKETVKTIEELFHGTEFVVNFYIRTSPEDKEKLNMIDCVDSIKEYSKNQANLVIKVVCKGYDHIIQVNREITNIIGKNNIIKIEMINPDFSI